MDMFADFFRLNHLNSSDTTFQQKSEVLSEDDKLDLKNLCSDAYLKDPFNQNNLT